MSEQTHIHLDPIGGIAGDMFVAAMVAARPDLEERVLADVAAALPPGIGRAGLTDVLSGGIAARHFALDAHGTPQVGHARSAHAHGGHHHHHHHHAPQPSGGGHGSASFAGMKARIADAALSPGTADAAIAILTILAEAEARMHRVAVEDVHFHEIGDWDSLMDVVAAGSIAGALQDATWSTAPLPLGAGMVRTAHGLLPVPAPATAEILKGFDWRDDGIAGERVTPTGAAILRHLVGDSPAPRPASARLTGIGYGAGSRHLPGLPNVLRASVFAVAAGATGEERLCEVAFDIDDMTGEEIAEAADRLRAQAGVRDLRLVSAFGKKGRPLTTFALLVEPGHLDAVADAAFLQTSTLGLRWHEVRRRVLPREQGTTAEGRPVKSVRRPDGRVTAKVESDALAAAPTLAERRRLGTSGD